MKNGLKIKKLRVEKGMTQENLAEKTDLTTRTIQRIEW
ncbi:helix-turn-helix domain-containing protein [bacterium]|nr:helix-turn-helix domain-containing protein [bacterium]